jgi:hypothetical protein
MQGPMLKGLALVDMQMPLPLPLSLLQNLSGRVGGLRKIKVVVSKVVASKVVVVKKAVTGKLMHEADRQQGPEVTVYSLPGPLNSNLNLFETIARIIAFFACCSHWKLGHESKSYRL